MHNLYILPFDHRNNFTKVFFGNSAESDTLTPEQIVKISDAKKLIYEAFKLSVRNGLPKEETAILVDEKFGTDIIIDAVKNHYVTAICVEKTGKEVFEFEYGNNFRTHIEKFHPNIVKALIRYNPENNVEDNRTQQSRLKELSDYCHANNYELLLEPLVIATKDQLEKVANDRVLYDKTLRPGLTVKMIQELQNAGVETDIWKIEGLYSSADYQKVVDQARTGGRNNVIVIVLGRAESQANVELWLKEGAKINGVNGFAVGRTVFMADLEKVIKGEIQREKAIENISHNFVHFYNFFKQNQLNLL